MVVATAPAHRRGCKLTTNDISQEGGLAYSSSVPSSLGLDVTFDSYQYAGDGADGIVFFLAASDPNNASASPVTLGPFGGHLGYSADIVDPTHVAGLTHGYLGFGLDVYGNYTNAAYEGTGCDESLGQTPESVTVRGPGDGTTGYCFLQTQHLNDSTLDNTEATAVPVEIAVNPTGGDLPAAGSFNVPAHSYVIRVTPIGSEGFDQSGPLPSDTSFVPDPSWVDSNGVPFQLTFGWAASTGASKDYHTISNVNVQTLNGTPPALSVDLSNDSGGTATTGQKVNYLATVGLSDADETRPITLTDTFPADLVPQTSGLGASGWACGVSGQTVTCTHAPPTQQGVLSTIHMPVLVSVPAGSPVALTDIATAGAPDATQGSDTDTTTYSPAPVAPKATVLGFVTQPLDVQVNTTMKNADSSTTHIRVAADVTAGGAVDTTYTGNVTLAFGTNAGSGSFVVGGSPASSITVAAVNGVADFSPIIVNATGFGYTLKATASGLTAATSNTFNVVAAATTCASGKTCTVTTTSPTTGLTASIAAGAGSGKAVITATFGGNVAPIRPCTGATAGILTFSGNRQKTITLKIPIKQASLVICYGSPRRSSTFSCTRPRTSARRRITSTKASGPCASRSSPGPCVKSISFTKTRRQWSSSATRQTRALCGDSSSCGLTSIFP